MNALEIVYVNWYLETLRSDLEPRDSSSSFKRRTVRDRLGAAAAALREVLGTDSGPVVPQLRDYPYGG